jgi:hypothetical protein
MDGESDLNLNLVDSLAWNVSIDPPEITEITQAPDPEDLFSSVAILGSSDRSTQMDMESEFGASGWLVAHFESPSLFGDDPRSPDAKFVVDNSGDLIMPGMMPPGSLLGSGDGPTQTGVDGVEHVAELSPLERSSSLALVATLWRAPSKPHASLDDRKQSDDGPIERLDAGTLPSWMAFVSGADQAFERSSREVRQGPLTEGGRPAGMPTDRLEWRGPIVPATAAEMLESSRVSPPTARPAPSSDAIGPTADLALASAPGDPAIGELQARSRSDAGHHADAEQRPTALTGRPTMLSAVAGLTLIAGWFLSRRFIWLTRRPGAVGVKVRPNG